MASKMDCNVNLNCKLVVKSLKHVLESNSSELEDVLKGSLSRFSSNMLAKALISPQVKESERVSVVISEFMSGCGFSSLPELQLKWHGFLDVLEDLGGPQSAAATTLETELSIKLKKEALDLSFPSRYNRSSSTPENVVSIKPKINRKAYSEDHGQVSSMQQFHAFESNDGLVKDDATVHEDVSTTTAETTSPIYFHPRQEGDINAGLSRGSSEFMSNVTRPAPTDPHNPIILGNSTGNVSQVTSAPATNDSEIPGIQRISSAGTFSQSQHDLFSTPTRRPSQAMSDPQNSYVLSEEKKERQEATNRLIAHLELRNEELKKELQEVRKENNSERMKLSEERDKVEQIRRTLITERKELSKKKKQMELTQHAEMKKLLEERERNKETQEKLFKREQEFLQKEESDKRQFAVQNEYLIKERKELHRLKKDQEEVYHQKFLKIQEQLSFIRSSEIAVQKQEKLQKAQNDNLKERERKLQMKHAQVLQQEKQVNLRSQELDKQTSAGEEKLRNQETELLEQERSLQLREQKVANREQEVTDREQELADKEQKLVDIEQEVANRNRKMNARDREVANRDQKVAKKELKVADREREVAAKDREVADREQKVADREQLVADNQKLNERRKERCEVRLKQQQEKLRIYRYRLKYYNWFLRLVGIVLFLYTLFIFIILSLLF